MKRPSTDSDDESGRAYSALMSLLAREPTKKIAKPNLTKRARKADLADTIEGVVMEKKEDDTVDNSESDEEIETGLDTNEDAEDPFEWHFASVNLSQVKTDSLIWSTKPAFPELGKKTTLRVPVPGVFDETKLLTVNAKRSLASLKIKHRLQASFEKANKGTLTELQRDFARPLLNYRDIFYTHRDEDSLAELKRLLALHALNHVFKTRDRVIKDNHKLAQDAELELPDQGFTRPKVLILLPTRNAAADFVDAIASVSGLRQLENKKRFADSFRDNTELPDSKPADFRRAFAGNTNDLFWLGLKFTRQATKLYSPFYSSDIIIASPLGLKMVIGQEGSKKRDYDFLSSIELAIVDQAEMAYMQSWEHVEHIFAHMNLLPKEAHGCDFARVRPWYLDEQAKLLRQTVILTDYATPEMQSLFSRFCHNLGGLVKAKPEYYGAMASLGVRLRQIYVRLPPCSLQAESDERFKYFCNSVLPPLFRGASHHGTLIFVPDYFDFVRVRNFLERGNHSYVALSEYTKPGPLVRGRAFFADKRAKIALYSQRLHHFRRFSLRGVHHIVFYGLPDNPIFYREIVRFLARTVIEEKVDPDMLRVQVCFSRFDALKLERIVGSSRVGGLIEGSNETSEFY